jgi:PilZ domain
VSDHQRRQQRYERRIEVSVSVAGGEAKTAFTRNMSLGGLYLESADRPALGARAQLKFRIPTQKDVIEVGATVRWIDDSGFGVQFDGLRAKDVYALGKFYEQPAG